MSEPLDLDAIEPNHSRVISHEPDADGEERAWDHCNYCVEDWPCETTRLLALARAQAAEIARQRDWIDRAIHWAQLVSAALPPEHVPLPEVVPNPPE